MSENNRQPVNSRRGTLGAKILEEEPDDKQDPDHACQ